MLETAHDHKKSNPAPAPRGRILIVDDEEVIASTLRELHSRPKGSR